MPLGEGCTSSGVSLEARTVKNLLAMQKTQVLSLVWEDTLEMGMATLQILACRTSWMGYSPWGQKESNMNTFTLNKMTGFG